jgi:hypothetical protein
VADLQRVIPHNDALDEQLQDPLLVGQGRLFKARPRALTERLQVGPHLTSRVPLGEQPRLLLALSRQDLPAAGNLFAPLLEFGQVDRLPLVGVQQALLLTVELSQARLPLALRGSGVIRLLVRLVCEGLELCQQRRGVIEQLLDVVPNSGFQLIRLDRATWATAVTVTDHTILAVALVVAVFGMAFGRVVGHAEHGEAAGPARQ